jgi:hypothetical protein
MVNQFSSCCTAPYLNGMTVLEYYSLAGINAWAWLAIEFAFTVLFFAGSWACLAFLKHQRR